MLKNILKRIYYFVTKCSRRFNRYVNTLLSKWPIPLNKGCARTVILAGVGRTGTTWVADILNYKNRFRYIFEPLHPKRMRMWDDVKATLYWTGEETDSYFAKQIDKIFNDEVREDWMDERNRRFLYRRKLIKFIFANMSLKGFNRHYPGMSTILLFRHPCASVYSQIRDGRTWGNIDNYLAQPGLVNDHLKPFVELGQSLTDKFEQHVWLWCVQYYVPLKVLKPGEVHLAFYEELCTNPKEEIDKMFKFIDEPYDEEVYEYVLRPSNTTWHQDAAIRTGASLTDNWRKGVSESQIKRTVEILKAFGLDQIYNESSLPNSKAAYDILSKTA